MRLKFLSINIIINAVLALALGSVANAVSVTVGPFIFDDSAYADTATVVSGSVSDIGNLIDGNLETSTDGVGSGDIVRFSFTDNVVVNGAGFDILVFEGGFIVENQTLLQTQSGSGFAGDFLGSVAGSPQINIFGFDLTDLGVAANAQFTGDLFIRQVGPNSPDLLEIVALNSVLVSTVPVPAALPLFGTGLAIMGFVGWRRKRKVAA